MDNLDQFKNIIDRIEKLETAVFKISSHNTVQGKNLQEFVGAKGGICLLITKDYFEELRSAQEVKSELASNKYFYSIQVVQTALNRLAKEKGSLVAIKSKGKKMYVKRK